MLSRFLSDTFPTLTEAPDSDPCWVAKVISLRDEGLFALSDALEVVEIGGEINSFRTRLKREHPLDKIHDEQYDWRVKDCLTEACAFAWATQRDLEPLTFSDTEGTPDIRLSDGRWVEVKAIHPSQEEDERMKRMLAGGIDSGQVALPGSGLYRKFEAALEDTVKKFKRQNQQASNPNIVFFNLTGLDTPPSFRKDSALASLKEWADSVEHHRKDDKAADVKLVMCYKYEWKAPFRDPFEV